MKPETAEQVDGAQAGWRGQQGEAYRDRNPVDADGTEVSWQKRFAISRRGLLQALFQQVVPIGSTWLDVGCSGGAQMEVLESIGQVCLSGCDVNLPALSTVSHGPVVADARALPYADRSFDGVTTVGTLMHVGPDEYLRTAVQECARVARYYLLFSELWQPVPMNISFGDLLPPAWCFPWERVVPWLLGSSWTLERSWLVRSCGEVPRAQPIMTLLLRREGAPAESGMWEGEWRGPADALKDLRLPRP